MSEYVGGQLEINLENTLEHTGKQLSKPLAVYRIYIPRGAGVVFLSSRFHRVLPIRSGVRYALINWIN